MRHSPARGEGAIPELLNLVYEAATNSTVWDHVLAALAGATQSSTASFLAQDFERQNGNALWHFGADPALAAQYKDWAPRNPWLLVGAPNRIQTGDVRNAEEVLPDRVACKTDFFNGFLRELGVLHNIGACVFREQTLIGMLNVFRPLGHPSYTEADVRFFRILMPHLQRAVLINRQLHELDCRRSAAEEVLDRLPLGVVLLDRRGNVLYVNPSARATFEQSDGLALAREGLTTARASESATLRRMIAGACAPDRESWRDAGGWLSVSRPSGRRSFVLMVAPLRMAEHTLASRVPGAIVFVGDSERKGTITTSALRHLYGLTAAEATVASLLLEGSRVEQISARLSVTQNTARTHLKRIFDKVGARTQSELVRLLLSNPGVTCSPGSRGRRSH